MLEDFKEFILFVFSSPYGDIIYCILGFWFFVSSFRKFSRLFNEGSFSDTKNKDIYIDKDGNWIEVFRD